ncbi:hypothetical protein PCH_Pc22g03760 [Penicillium rubens Wisconsin 54-1255]|uniref:Uncharacterized protein n=1 Tax=Penicillium rubens (strain ATCC 28089 / DSM 1075 / NRRL 1951 / Wisconsin 54-1255) TaxID=500485 RepID=B6HS63_PENRW|nr:hypothetical protein PCH_Pc22g03760 [Penicillium rubens Wisconsin 54-1255]
MGRISGRTGDPGETDTPNSGHRPQKVSVRPGETIRWNDKSRALGGWLWGGSGIGSRTIHHLQSAILRVLPQILRIHDENLDLDCKAFLQDTHNASTLVYTSQDRVWSMTDRLVRLGSESGLSLGAGLDDVDADLDIDTDVDGKTDKPCAYNSNGCMKSMKKCIGVRVVINIQRVRELDWCPRSTWAHPRVDPGLFEYTPSKGWLSIEEGGGKVADKADGDNPLSVWALPAKALNLSNIAQSVHSGYTVIPALRILRYDLLDLPRFQGPSLVMSEPFVFPAGSPALTKANHPAQVDTAYLQGSLKRLTEFTEYGDSNLPMLPVPGVLPHTDSDRKLPLKKKRKARESRKNFGVYANGVNPLHAKVTFQIAPSIRPCHVPTFCKADFEPEDDRVTIVRLGGLEIGMASWVLVALQTVLIVAGLALHGAMWLLSPAQAVPTWTSWLATIGAGHLAVVIHVVLLFWVWWYNQRGRPNWFA